MIRSSPVGVSPQITMSINGAPINYNSLMSIALDLEENKHDMCEFVMSGVPSRSITDFIDKNVFVRITTGATMINEFYGTVFSSRPVATTSAGMVNNNLFQEVKFTCFGCSWAMRGAQSRVWKNSTLVDVATSMANTYGFSCDVPNDDLVFNTLVQAESDWHFLCRYADSMGYSVTVHGTHIHIFDPHRAKGRMISLHRLYAPARTSPRPHPGQVITFDGDFANRVADGKYFDNVITVLPDSGGTFDVRTSDVQGFSEPAAFTTRLNLTADSYNQADRMIQALYRSDYDYRADSVTLGTAGMLPGGMATLDGYSTEFDGLWYVSGVRHDVKSGSFLSMGKLRRNSMDTLVDESSAQFRPPPLPQQINGVWTSTKKVTNAY